MHTVLSFCKSVATTQSPKQFQSYPYALKLSLAEFFLFPKLKAGLKQCQFESAKKYNKKMLQHKTPNFFKITYRILVKMEKSLQ